MISFFYSYYLRLKWIIEKFFCRVQVSVINKKNIKIDTNNVFNGKKIILMPHSDDEWIGCSQILMHDPANCLVVNMNMCGGDSRDIHEKRFEEATRISKHIGYNLYTVHLDKKEEDLKEILLCESPSFVFIPSIIDWHEEHIEVMNLFYRAANMAHYYGNVAMYQVSVPIPIELINSGSILDKKSLKSKWNMFSKTYLTQGFFPKKRFMAIERINGGLCKAYALEAYALLDYQAWCANYFRFSPTKEEMEEIKQNLKSIYALRKFSQTYYLRKSS